MSDRKLVRIVELDDVIEHTNADSLELAIIGGWQCCVKKDEFKKGDIGIYFEIDSMIPLENEAFAFLAGRNERTKDGVRYSRIKTMKLRKELSQGLLLPLSTFGLEWQLYFIDQWSEVAMMVGHKTWKDAAIELCELAEPLGVIKYEVDMPACMRGNAEGLFPQFIRKTDQERIQNLKREHEKGFVGETFEVSVKLDGSSLTAFVFRKADDEIYTGVCSRNYELKVDESNEGNTFVQTFKRYNLDQRLREYHERTGKFIAIQGEMIGPGIQANFEGVDEVLFRPFSVFDITEQKYLLPAEARRVIAELGLEYVPVFATDYIIVESIKELIDMAEGPSGMKGKYREGLVFKSNQRQFSFKAISNSYLLKNDG